MILSVRGWPRRLASEVRQDVRLSLRMYVRRPLVALFSIAALAIGVGATSGVFTVVNAVLLRSLPFRDPGRLAAFRNFPTLGVAASEAQFRAWRTGSDYLEDAAVYMPSDMNVAAGAQPVRVKVTEATANFFSLLGVEPQLGRGFVAGEDIPGKDDVAVISYPLWQQMFGSDPRALGGTIRVNGRPFLVIGVTRPGFDFPQETRVWTSTLFDWGKLPEPGALFPNLIGRLRRGLTPAAAQSRLDADVKRLTGGKSEWRGELVPLQTDIASTVERASLVLLGAVVFVLLIACANVANLLLARITERRRELMIRTAVGASSHRLLRQMLTECTVLAVAAGAAGLLVASWTARLIETIHPPALLSQQYDVLDWQVLGFAAALSVAIGLFFAVLPARRISRLAVADSALRGGGRAGRGRLRGGLVAVQAALTLVLLAGAITMVDSLQALLGADSGFRTAHVLTLRASLAGSLRQSDVAARQFCTEALERLRAWPGVQSAAAVNYLPLGRESLMMLPNRLDSTGASIGAVPGLASPQYFRTMGIPIVAGRDFNSEDTESSQPVAIVSEDIARRIGGTESALGRTLSAWNGKAARIIGVAGSVRLNGPAQSEPLPQVYLPVSQENWHYFTFVVKTAGEPGPLAATARAIVQSVDPHVAVYDIKTLAERLEKVLAQARFYTKAIGLLGVFAAFLAVLGTYAVVSHSVAQRTQEIGVRLAMGGTVPDVRRLFLGRSLGPVLAGSAVGIAGIIGVGRFLASLMVGARPIGVAGSLGAAALLTTVAAAAVWAATTKIAHLQPSEVLKTE